MLCFETAHMHTEENMEIQVKRINSYEDKRFSTKVLYQHGAFVVNDILLYEVEIISAKEAVVRGDETFYTEVIEEFRFYAEHITKFYDEKRRMIREFEEIKTIDVLIEKIQPSQFYVDITKKLAVENFIHTEEDVIVPLVEYEGRYISMDGHTRLSVAIEKGFKSVKGIIVQGDDWLYGFVREAIKRNINSPYDLETLSHEEYEIKWNHFCDEFFEQENE